MKPTLILDIDGVVLRWSSRLVEYLSTKGPVNPELARKISANEYLDLSFMDMDAIFEYHRSPYIAELHPLETDTADTIALLAARYQLIALSSFSADPQAQQARRKNLQLHFGDGFSKVYMLPTLSSKKAELLKLVEQHDVVGYVDDGPKYIQEGVEVLGPERTFWLNSYNFNLTLPCRSISSLAELPNMLVKAESAPSFSVV